MTKDPRDHTALRDAPELAEVSASPDFDAVDLVDLRRLAELIREFGSGSLAGVTIETAKAFGRGSSDRFQRVQRALRLLVGEEHPATVAVVAARCLVTRNTPRPGARHRDQRSREAILEGAHWAPFRALPGAQTVDLQPMRAVDRYLLFVEASGLPGGDEETFLAFVEDQISSMLLRLVRLGLEELLTSAHPAVVAAERARSRKETERKLRRQGDPVPTPPRPVELTASVAYEELPEAWKALFAKLRAGKKVRGRRRAPKTVDNMIGAARQYVRSVRDAGLPAVLDEAGLRAFDDALATRKASAPGRQIRFSSLQLLADQLPGHDAVVAAIAELCGHYAREARGEIKAKEARLEKLPEIREIFAKANALLDAAETTTDRRRRTTLFVDAAALAVLSLVPLRDEDTVLFWGRHITWSGDAMFEASGDVDAQQACYRIDLRTSKTSESLAGPLAPILTPFLDALILQGQDPRLLPDLRRRAMAARGPVFPTLTGEARGPRSLSARWSKQVGVGSRISRTRVHTLLGAMGESGVRAALALCAQHSPRTAVWYQAEALAARRMSESQEMLQGLLDLSEEDEALLAGL